MKNKRSKNRLTESALRYIKNLQEEGRYSTAHVYKNAILSFSKFCGTPNLSFQQINRESIRRYEQYLKEYGLKLNTISTYMRMLRSIYNRGVEAGHAHFIPHLFHDVFTGIDVPQKKALPIGELHNLLYKTPQTPQLCRVQSIARLMFQLCGMPFADFANMEKSALSHGVLRYNRIKTGTPICIQVLPESQKEIELLYNNNNLPKKDYPNYLFSILKGDKMRKEKSKYKEYQSSLRLFNNQLKRLSKAFNLESKVTTYTLRHSWATTAKYQGIPIEMISESLGHKSIKTTQIYLKGFDIEKRTEANKTNCLYVKNYKA